MSMLRFQTGLPVKPKRITTVADLHGATSARAPGQYTLRASGVLVPATMSVSKATVYVTTAAGNVMIGVYDENWNRLTYGSLALAATGLNTVTFNASATLYPGHYYIALVVDDATTAFLGATGTYVWNDDVLFKTQASFVLSASYASSPPTPAGVQIAIVVE